jgi:hypothetical protein
LEIPFGSRIIARLPIQVEVVAMVITLGPDLESALSDLAQKQGVSAEILALSALSERFLAPTLRVQPRDDWERRLLGAATDCGVALSHKAVSSDELYE